MLPEPQPRIQQARTALAPCPFGGSDLMPFSQRKATFPQPFHSSARNPLQRLTAPSSSASHTDALNERGAKDATGMITSPTRSRPKNGENFASGNGRGPGDPAYAPMAPYGMGYGGYGMGTYGYGGMMNPMMMGGMMGGPFAWVYSLNYFIGSLDQIMGMLGMNTQALVHLYQTSFQLFHKAVMAVRQSP